MREKRMIEELKNNRFQARFIFRFVFAVALPLPHISFELHTLYLKKKLNY